MLSKSKLQDMRESWVRAFGNIYRSTILQLLDSHLVASEKIESLEAELAAARDTDMRADQCIGCLHDATCGHRCCEYDPCPFLRLVEVDCTCLGCGTTIRMDAESARIARSLSWRCDSCQAINAY